MATVLKKFMWAGNGHTVESLAVGDVRDFGAAAAGLAAEGFVSLDAAVVSPAEVETAMEPVVEIVDPVIEPVIEIVATEPVAEVVTESVVAEPVVAPAPETKRRRKS